MTSKMFLLLLLFLSTQVASAQTIGIAYFDFNSSNLRKEAKTELNKIVASKNIQSLGIFGHTDQVGTEAHNEWLSLQRARAVRDYLLARGLPPEKISVVLGFGTTRLISTGLDDLSRQQNRRVVLMNAYSPSRLDRDLAAQQANITVKPDENKTVAATQIFEKPLPARHSQEPVVKQQKNEKLVEDIKDNSIKAGEHIVLKNINFHPGKSYFLQSAFPALQDLLEAMQKINTLQVEIQGHVCCTEDDTDALDVATGIHNLSVKRAKAVHDYLVEKGIDPSRISFKGLAHQSPLIKVEKTEEDRIANRRVEIKIIKK